MIRLVSRKEEQKGGLRSKKSSAAFLRVQKDMSELVETDTYKVEYSQPHDFLNFLVHIKPDHGYYKNGKFTFTFKISNEYPHEAPKIKCNQKIFHPNIDIDGNVCLNILRQDWKPVLTITAIINGLLFLFSEPNPDDPLNKEAAEILKTNCQEFENLVRKSMNGISVKSRSYDKVI